MKKIIDISMVLTSKYEMHTPEGVKPIQLDIEVIKDHPGGAGQIVRAIHCRLHTGTHIDSPEHFVKGGTQLHEIPLDTFVGLAIIADMTHKVPGGAITAQDLESDVGSLLIAGDRLLIKTGWNTHHHGQPNYVEDSPYLSLDALQWCVEKKIKLLGQDYAHQKDDPKSPSLYYNTSYILENGIVILSSLFNLEDVSEKRVELICLPLALQGVEASPVRAVVIENSNRRKG